MPVPNLHVTISGSVVAVYAAVVSTITGSVQLWHFFRDRARIKLTVQRNMEIVGDPRYARKSLTIVRVANQGRRPVTITTVGAYNLFPDNPFIIPECNPALPHELTEGKSLMAIIPSCDLDFSAARSSRFAYNRIMDHTRGGRSEEKEKTNDDSGQKSGHTNRTVFSRISFQSQLARSSKYRPDIDGLRAIAVLTVLLYHAGVSGFSGGFVGVDIFFVVSGYLITSIIAKDEDVGKFSIVSFYDRRLRRIFPALFGVVFFCVLGSAFLLVPSDFALFGKSLLAMTFFVSNIFFMRTGGTEGYFAADSHSKLLLHTWSLSVEEQFYLFFPTFLILLTRLAKRHVSKFLWVVIGTSFAINIWATKHKPTAAFYFLLPRAWELLLGSILAIRGVPALNRRLWRELAGFIGLGLIAWAVWDITESTPFPGFWGLLPCLGAWLIIYAGKHGPWSAKTILSFKPLVFIGVISYSLYLWHWPIIVFAKILTVRDVSEWSYGEITAVVFLSLMMAFLSFEYIESPFRGERSPITRRQIFLFGLATSAVSAVLGFSIYMSAGFPGRFNDYTQQLITKNLERKQDFEEVCANWKSEIRELADLTVCNLGEQSEKKIMFLGDSHVQQLFPLIRRIRDNGRLPQHGVVFTVAPGCLPAEHMNRPEPGYHCDSFSHFALLRAEQEDVDTVFIGFAPPGNLCPSVDDRCVGKISKEEMHKQFYDGLSKNIQTLKMHGKRVVLSLPFPMFDKSPPDLLIRNAMLGRFQSHGTPTNLVPNSLRNQLARLAEEAGAQIFDPTESLCRAADCVTQRDGVSIYKDDNHLAATQIGILQDNMEGTLLRVLPTQ
jgi:peptidoglycan/LPS O-acetylase OafA/YrhL